MSIEEENRVIQAMQEQISRMQDSSNDTMSKLFYDFKDDFNAFKIAQAEEHTKIGLLLEEMIEHQKHTNGNVMENKKAVKRINKILLGSGVCILLLITSALTIEQVGELFIKLISFV